MNKSRLKGSTCPKCGYTFERSNREPKDERCPRCGAKAQGRRRQPIPLLRLLVALVLLFAVVGGLLVASLAVTNEGVATEFKQIPQPRPNRFHLALDVSGTIRPDALADIRRELLRRLRQFVGERTVAYEVFVFGLPGCGTDGIRRVVSTASPETLDYFAATVERPIERIRITRRSDGVTADAPLTTPFYRMLETLLTDHPGDRIIVISDLVNDEYHCDAPSRFPLKAVVDFGAHPSGQIEFLYTAPYTVGEFDTPSIREAFAREQRQFIERMQTLQSEGKIRVWFHRIPDDPHARQRFLAARIHSAIPATTVEMVWAKVRQLLAVIVLGVRA